MAPNECEAHSITYEAFLPKVYSESKKSPRLNFQKKKLSVLRKHEELRDSLNIQQEKMIYKSRMFGPEKVLSDF